MKYVSKLYLENGNEEEEKKESKPIPPKKDKELQSKIIKFFEKNPNPSDKEVHKFAESMGMEPDDLEARIYKILGSFLRAGKSKTFKG